MRRSRGQWEEISARLIINDDTQATTGGNINLSDYFYRAPLMEIKYLDRGTTLFNADA